MALSGSVLAAELVETATGEVFQLRQPRKRVASFGRRFTVIFDHAYAQLAADLGGTAARLMLVLPSKLDFRSWKPLRQADLAEMLNVNQSGISRALAELKKHCAVESQGRGSVMTWRLSRKVGYRGSVAQFHADQRSNVSHDAEPAQPVLKLGPSRVIKGGRKDPPKVVVSQDHSSHVLA